MLSQDDLDRYLNSIPPLPESLKACKKALDDGDMIQLADEAVKDKALYLYFKNIVNKPIFGFSKEVKNMRQIFGVLGIVKARQIFQSYFTCMLLPKKWQVFNLTSSQFNEIQASFIIRWAEILKTFDIKDKDYETVVTLVPAAIAVCEAIFEDHIDMIKLIKSQKNISYEAILYKLSGYDFFDIVKIIAQKWEIPETLLGLLSDIKTIDGSETSKDKKLLIYLILLINYEISQPVAIQSGINGLFEFTCSFDMDDVEYFYEIMSRVET